MKYVVTYEDGTHKLETAPLRIPASWSPSPKILSIVREDQVLVSPRKVHERTMELWVNEGAPGDELPEGRHYRRALADLEGEGMKA